MSLFNAFGNVSHGIADNIGSSTDPTTPLIYRYTGTEQTSWSVGGSVTLPLETLFDLPGKIKRQRIQVDIAELRKQQAYEELKIQIAHLYVQILSNTKPYNVRQNTLLYIKVHLPLPNRNTETDARQ